MTMSGCGRWIGFAIWICSEFSRGLAGGRWSFLNPQRPGVALSCAILKGVFLTT
jgi:hypothetical protein